ncbi:MAG: single-stranded DNA-binding protein [SAR202 cluster bacterium]|nr:single-stranded DNA-binding protein [SAR202 cluster bacterium]
MAAGLNKIMIIGNLGTDPEMRYTPNGNPVTSFRVAVGRTYTPADGQRREETEWFTVSAWNQLAEQCNQYLTKGRRIYVEGRLRSSTWTGNDGQTRFRNEIVANQVMFLDRGPDAGQQDDEAPAGGSGQAAGSGEVSDADDLPW